MTAIPHRLGSWDDLRFFLAVARQGGLSSAARELGVNQSTVFRRIERLEEQLDARLFERRARGYALTAVGEHMLMLATRVEDDVLALDRAVAGSEHELRGVVRVTTVMEVFERIAPHLRRFRDLYPGIELELSTDLRVLSLTRREADVAIRPGARPTEPDVVGRKLAALELAAYASPTYLASRERPSSPADLKEHDLIRFIQVTRPVDAALDDARVVFRADGMPAQATAARAGLGVALLPTFLGDHAPDLERLFTLTAPEDVHLWLLIHADLRQTARVRAFVDFLTEAIDADRDAWEG